MQVFYVTFYLFWPLLYGLSWKLGWEKQTFTLMVFALAAVLVAPSAMAFETYFDDEKRKEYYKKVGENIENGKGSFFKQSLYWILPILIPILFDLVPMLINYFK